MKINANGIEIHYTFDGPASAPVVMMSHSLATDSAMWEPQIGILAANYRVLRYDTRGHGQTSAPGNAYTMELLAADARALLKALGIERIHWVGISMGGMIGQTLALSNPELFMSLTLCDTVSEFPAAAHAQWQQRIELARGEGMAALVEPTIDRWFSPGFVTREGAVVERIREMIRTTPVAGFIGCGHAIPNIDVTDRLPEIGIPTLIIVGEDDQGTPVSASRLINDKIRGSELLILPLARHLTNIESAAAFNTALARFLSSV